ncbi:protein Gemin2 [Contarinia nasturtii]|uniref:protein Gemin2 n=1 Tax=Contarinia nasturtii TaxID=265458 RepID=UPI0012D461FB|nr:protein Gemin2 [Contarinia nasturtii]
MDSFQQPAFCFNMPTDEYDPNQVPVDGEQYLQSVIYERKKCPAVVVRPVRKIVEPDCNTTMDSKAGRSVWDQYAEVPLADQTPKSLLPTTEWLQLQSYSFQKLHDRITNIRQTFRSDYEHAELPNDNTEESWLEYCQNKEPLLNNMLHINQRDLELVIEYQSNWLVDDLDWYLTNRNWFPQWVYCSLCCLRLPCEPNLLNSLRKISKTCHRVRSKLKAEDFVDSAMPLNLIICIVSRNFDQFDLGGQTQ